MFEDWNLWNLIAPYNYSNFESFIDERGSKLCGVIKFQIKVEQFQTRFNKDEGNGAKSQL